MPNIKPVSDLRNYNEVLRDISVGQPVFLTKNGRGRYVIIDMDDYEKQKLAEKQPTESREEIVEGNLVDVETGEITGKVIDLRQRNA